MAIKKEMAKKMTAKELKKAYRNSEQKIHNAEVYKFNREHWDNKYK